MLKKDVAYRVEGVDSFWVSAYGETTGSIQFTCRGEATETITVTLTHEQLESIRDQISDRLEGIKRDKIKKAKALVNAESDD
jgi:hypothetical protein